MKKEIAFLYPASPLNYKTVDEGFEEEFVTAKEAGLNVHVIDTDNLLSSRIVPMLPENSCIVYRGWMLSENQYSNLETRFGDRLLTPKERYLDAHHFPNWYTDIQDLTIPSIVTNEAEAPQKLHAFNGKAFIKDYVKSLKTGKGSIVEDEKDLQRALADMKFYRGVIEGGIVLREVMHLKPNSETRFFVVKNQIFGPNNVSDKSDLVQEVVDRLKSKDLNFYSVDVATLDNGKNIVIEIGDGQVSDMVGWQAPDFIKVLSHI